MNRTLDGARALLLVTLLAAPARAQAPLTVGSVRDQHGTPIAGADITARTPSGAWIAASTDGAGTFALHGGGISSIVIKCRYCEPTSVAVNAGEPVIAIVRRYDALAADSPTPGDLANLPYAHVESSVALRPFTLLSQSTGIYPGSRLSDRGLSSTGSLLVDNGTPNYDIVDGSSPFVSIPANYQQSADLRNASNAFLYGDQAAGGILELTPFLAGSSQEVATLGDDAIARVQIGSDDASLAAGTFSNDQESRQRTDLAATWALADQQTLSVAGGTEQGRIYQSPGSSLASSFSFGNAAFTDPHLLNLTLGALADRGSYGVTYGEYPIGAAWSDSGFSAGIHTDGAVSAFADAAVRSSTGFYDAQALPYGPPRIGAMLAQTRADAGIVASGSEYVLTAGVGAFWIDYAGGTYGFSSPVKTALAVPSIDARLFPNGKWNVNLQGSGSFTLPTFVAQYGVPQRYSSTVDFQRNSLRAGSLTYTDNARLRLSFEQASQNVTGATSGLVTSTGFSAAWQVAPAISLRAWTMHVNDTAPIYGVGLPYDGIAPTVNALWLTYENGGAVRIDAIYRRDLLDAQPFYHVDGAISGPISSRLRWYAGVEDRMRQTFVDAGLRLSAR
ncbi:MAG: carboxypeptidase-like regulatory domain-containing protein [Candidatus Baltobacteraceae bacterium]